MILDRHYYFYVQPSGGSYEPIPPEIIPTIEEITVEQKMDAVWEANIKLKIRADDKGNWINKPQDLLKPFTRVRIEVKVGNSNSVPLIDGSVVGHDLSMSSEPGESHVTITIADDSVYLHRNDEIKIHEAAANTVDHIVQECFRGFEDRIKPTCIEPVSRPAPQLVQRGSRMELLRRLGKEFNMHVYVLPGSEKGRSIGCFCSLPTKGKKGFMDSASLPNSGEFAPLILLGPERNIKSFDAKNDCQAPAEVTSAFLDPKSKKPARSTKASPESIGLIGDKMGHASTTKLPARYLSSYYVGILNQPESVLGEAERLSYAIEATGSVFTNIYPNILQPYRMIKVKGVGPEYSGSYLITQVTHTITPADYTQSFTLKGIAAT